MRTLGLLTSLCVACGGQSGSDPSEQPTRPNTQQAQLAAAQRAAAPPAAIAPPEADCATLVAALAGARETVVSPHRECAFTVDCTLLRDSGGCVPPCPAAVNLASLGAVDDGLTGVHNVHCPDIVEAGCEAPAARCPDQPVAICHSGRCVAAEQDTELDEAAIPPENEAGLAAPPPRPEPGDAEERAQRLLQAIIRDEPALAADFFFPQEAFRRVKAIPDPDAYWRRLFARYGQDIHALHEQLGDVDPETVHHERLEIVPRGGFVRRGEEGNALPYWAARHNWLHFTRGGEPDKIEVRVLITWGARWYITHLSEFH